MSNDPILINVSMVQAVALAIITYWLGHAIKERVGLLQKFSIPTPVVGGMLCALLLSFLDIRAL